MYMKATPGTLSGILLNMHDTQKENVHYLQMCSSCAFFLFWNIKQREEVCSHVIISNAASPPLKLEYSSIYFAIHMTTA